MGAGAHRPERHGQPAQPDGYRRGDNLADGKGPAADAHRAVGAQLGLSRDSVILLGRSGRWISPACANAWASWTARRWTRVNSAIAVSFGLAQ